MTLSRPANLFICILALAGCSKSQTSEQTESLESTPQSSASDSTNVASFAVIDLDLVAVELGATKTVNNMVDEHRAELNMRLLQIEDGHKKEYELMAARFGENPTEEQKIRLAKLEYSHAIALQQHDRDNNIKLATFRNQMSSKFMEEVKPIAHKIACKHGFNIVLSKGQFYVGDGKLDITSEVIEEIKRINAEAVIHPPSDSEDRFVEIPNGGNFQPIKQR